MPAGAKPGLRHLRLLLQFSAHQQRDDARLGAAPASAARRPPAHDRCAQRRELWTGCWKYSTRRACTRIDSIWSAVSAAGCLPAAAPARSISRSTPFPAMAPPPPAKACGWACRWSAAAAAAPPPAPASACSPMRAWRSWSLTPGKTTSILRSAWRRICLRWRSCARTLRERLRATPLLDAAGVSRAIWKPSIAMHGASGARAPRREADHAEGTADRLAAPGRAACRRRRSGAANRAGRQAAAVARRCRRGAHLRTGARARAADWSRRGNCSASPRSTWATIRWRAERFERVLALAGEDAQALANAAEANRRADRCDAGARADTSARSRSSPDFAPFLHIRVLALEALLARRRGARGLPRSAGAAPGVRRLHTSYMTLLNRAGADPLLILEAHRRWAERYAAPHPGEAQHGNTPQAAAAPAHRLCLGRFARARGEPFPVAPARASRSRRGFEVYCYSNTPKTDDITRRCESAGRALARYRFARRMRRRKT